MFYLIFPLSLQANLPKLSTLDLANCEVTTIDGYRETVFNILPQLKYLDNVDKTGGMLRRIHSIQSFIRNVSVERDSDDEDDDENAGSDEGK